MTTKTTVENQFETRAWRGLELRGAGHVLIERLVPLSCLVAALLTAGGLRAEQLPAATPSASASASAESDPEPAGSPNPSVSPIDPAAQPDGSAPVPPSSEGVAPATPPSSIVPTPRAPREDSGASASPPRTERSWYGWQTLIADGASIALVAGGASSRADGALIGAGVVSYLVGTPIIHGAHGNGWRAVGSFGMRLAPPVLTLLAFSCAFAHTHDSAETPTCDGAGELLVLSVLSFGAVITIDAAALAYEDVPVESTMALHFTPFIDPKTHRAGLSLGGAF